MKRLLALSPLALLFWAATLYADPKETRLAVSPKGIKITYSDLPRFTDANANFTGIKNFKLNGNDLLKDTKNRLVLRVRYDATGTADNLVWSLEEWLGGDPYDRDKTTLDTVESEIFKGSGRLFIGKKLRGELKDRLKRKRVVGTTHFTAGNASLVIKDPKLNAQLATFGGHQGATAITGQLDSFGNAEVVQFRGKVTGTAFINDSGDSGDRHQVTLSIDINAKLIP